MRFTCWEPWNEDEVHASEVEELDVEHAATRYASDCYENGDTFDEIDICVRDGEGVLWEVSVTVEAEPVFCGTSVRRVSE